MRRAATATCLLGVLAVVGCSGAAEQADGAPEPAAAAPSDASPTTGAAGSSDPVLAACTDYVDSAVTPRLILEQAAAQPLLGPAVALGLLDVREVATTASSLDGAVGTQFVELVAAVDELAGQLDAGLPEGALAVETPVPIDGARLGAALDALDTTCTQLGVPPLSGTASAPATP